MTFWGLAVVQRIRMCNRLFAVGKPVGITVGIVRVRAVGKFFAVGDTVAITVRFCRIGSR